MSDTPLFDALYGEMPPRQLKTDGFATTPEVLRYGGPQMEDYPDLDSWYFARQKWVANRMNPKPPNKE